MRMGKTKASNSRTAVRKSPPKPPALPKGYGALRGQLRIRPGIDLTKPIYDQWVKLERRARRGGSR
jgi:hypothetical protein